MDHQGKGALALLSQQLNLLPAFSDTSTFSSLHLYINEEQIHQR